MANLTVTVDREVLRRARIRALQEETSVNALVRHYLERYSGAGPAASALAGFLDLAGRHRASSGRRGRAWTRDELHDRSNIR